MSITFNRDPLGDIPNFFDEFYKNASAQFEREKELMLQRHCEDKGWAYERHRIVCVIREDNKQLYYYSNDEGVLHPLVALAPLDVSWHDSPTDFSVKVMCRQRELHTDIFKPEIISCRKYPPSL